METWAVYGILYRLNPDAATPFSDQERTVTGRFLAHNRLSKRRKAFLAADITLGKVRPEMLTLNQAAQLARVSVVYVRAARKIAYCRPDLRSCCEAGHNPFPLRCSRPEAAVRLWTKMPPNERVEFAREVGPDALLDVAAKAE